MELKARTAQSIAQEEDMLELGAPDGIEPELVYLKSEADAYIGELKKERDWLAKDRAQAYDDLEKRAQLNIKQEEEIAELKKENAFLKVTKNACAYCNKCADGMGKVFDENLNELKAKAAQLEDDVAFWKSKAKRGYVKMKHSFRYLVFTETEQYGDIYHKADVDLAIAERDSVIEHQDYEIDKLREQIALLQSEFHKEYGDG